MRRYFERLRQFWKINFAQVIAMVIVSTFFPCFCKRQRPSTYRFCGGSHKKQRFSVLCRIYIGLKLHKPFFTECSIGSIAAHSMAASSSVQISNIKRQSINLAVDVCPYRSLSRHLKK